MFVHQRGFFAELSSTGLFPGRYVVSKEVIRDLLGNDVLQPDTT